MEYKRMNFRNLISGWGRLLACSRLSAGRWNSAPGRTSGLKASSTCLVVMAACLVLALTACSSVSTQAASRAPAMSAGHDNIVLACQGRVEGRTETVEVGAAADGVIQSVLVKEGDTVVRGAKLAEIACPDLQASLAEAVSQVESFRQVRVRLLRG